VKNEILQDFDGFLTVSGPKNSGKQHVIGLVLLRRRLQENFEKKISPKSEKRKSER